MYSSQMKAAVQSRASFGLCAGQLCGLAKGRPARLLLLPAPRPLLRSLQPLHRFWQLCQAASAILRFDGKHGWLQTVLQDVLAQHDLPHPGFVASAPEEPQLKAWLG